MSLTERCVYLHRLKPDVRIKRTTLSRIYKAHRIKYKAVKKIKVIPEKKEQFVEDTIKNCRDRFNILKNEGIPVVFLDESCLTTKTLPTHQWMSKYSNVELNEKKLNVKTLAFVVAISEDKGLVSIKTYPRSLDQYNFIEFLKVVKSKYGDQRFAVYLDSASFHKAKSVKKYAEENDIELLFAPLYSPEYQPCESVIGILKQ